MSLITIYLLLFALTFIACGISLMISERYFKDILIISILNVAFFLTVIIYRLVEKIAKWKIRRDFKIEPDEEDGKYHYRKAYWKAYGGNIEINTTWNSFKNNSKVIFRKMKEVSE